MVSDRLPKHKTCFEATALRAASVKTLKNATLRSLKQRPKIREATLGDCHALAPILRKADLAEIAAGSGRDPLAALIDSFEGSAQRFTIEAAGRPLAIFGGGPLPRYSDYTVGSPWMLGSDALRDHATWFLRSTPEIVERVARHYDLLLNAVDIRNTAHVRWLRFAGFTMGEVITHGAERRPFQLFTKARHV